MDWRLICVFCIIAYHVSIFVALCTGIIDIAYFMYCHTSRGSFHGKYAAFTCDHTMHGYRVTTFLHMRMIMLCTNACGGAHCLCHHVVQVLSHGNHAAFTHDHAVHGNEVNTLPNVVLTMLGTHSSGGANFLLC